MKTAHDALHDLRMISRHISILANADIQEDDIDALKATVREWATLAENKQMDAVSTIAVLLDAWERGVDITELREYNTVKQYAQAGD